MLRPINNPPNPFHHTDIDWEGEPPSVKLQVYEEHARDILSSNDSPDIGFRWSLNPYRGCYHGCSYCYARPYHHYLDWGAGTDFERKIVVKLNAPELLRHYFAKPSWQGERIVFSGVTDCYQPLEASYQLTRRCLEVCLEYKNPIGIITKGASVIVRDTDVLADLTRRTEATVFLSIPFSDDTTARIFEPFASLSSKRFRTLERLSLEGIRTGVAVAPVIPGINDAMIPSVLQKAKDAGATYAFMTLLRLPGPVREVFLNRLDAELPLRSEKVRHALTEVRQGKLNDSRFGSRMQGQGNRWDAISDLFQNQCQRLGLNGKFTKSAEPPSTFKRPKRQLSLL